MIFLGKIEELAPRACFRVSLLNKCIEGRILGMIDFMFCAMKLDFVDKTVSLH